MQPALYSNSSAVFERVLRSGFATEEQLNHVWEELKYFYWGDRESNFNFTSIHEARRLRLEQGQGEHAHKHHHNHHRSPQKHNNDHDATEKQGNTEHSLEHQQTKSLDQTVHATG